MLFRLAWASLIAHRSRTLLAVLGVAVSAAMLLDMVMLSSGMRDSFKALLLSRGFQLRIAPNGTLPFDTDATIADAPAVLRVLRAMPDVAVVSPVLGGQLHVVARDTTITAAAIANEPAMQGDYDILTGRAPTAPNELVASDAFIRATGTRLGDTLVAAAGFDAELRAFTGERRLVLVGRARFVYLPAEQRAVSLPIGTLSAMQGTAPDARVSLVMAKARDGADVDALLARVQAALPQVSVTSIQSAMQQVDQRLSYFRQLSLILGAVSLVVGFLLVATLVTVSVNERIGEIAILRAIGVARQRIVSQILIESVAIMVAGAALGLGLGLATARYLDSILSAFPGLPAAIDFFPFEPRDAWTALGLLVLAGLLAGLYPSWRSASLPIAGTLREEAIA
ncbi:MAG TPA: FtsX-like permease family protein [Gemmatimonadaceae bacterium]|nr:FtsX-like permease family protein [Gemmatimonadaceae bacterium]